MVEQAFPGTEVTYIKDVGNDEIWSAQLDKIIKEQAGPGQKVVLYGGRDSFIPHYKGKYPTEELVPSKYLSGKEIRKNVGIKSKHTQEFREGVVWAVENQWPVVLPTVDIAIFDRPNGKILMGRKPNQTRYRFIGGFADVNSPSFEADAIREVSEETGLVIKNPKYIASVRIDDWRYRGERNKITTTFFIADYEGGEPIGNSDIADVKWISVGDLHDDKFAKENIVPEHHVLIDALVEHLIDTPQVA
jgi:bifunctional NMN adenylyltransferase/nudix hydrolase